MRADLGDGDERPTGIVAADRRLEQALDELDSHRFDVLEIVDRLRAWDELDDDEREAELNLWEYSGLAQASSPLSAMLREGHNVTAAVRDLRGDLVLICEGASPEFGWSCGPLYGNHFFLAGEPVEGLSPREQQAIERIISLLPAAPGPVASF